MADLVGVIGTTHNPLMWGRVERGETPDDMARVVDNFGVLRSFVSDVGPDAIVLVGSDHFHMLFTNNMPAFLIGKAATMRGVFPSEVRSFGMRRVDIPGDQELARHLLGNPSLPRGFDFAFSDEPWLDHAFLVPLLFLDPDLEIPIVPVFTNTTSPPLPGAGRFAELGRYLRDSIQSFRSKQKVLIVGSGHLSHELGGPRQFLGASPLPSFDDEAVDWMRTGDLEASIEGSSFDRLLSAGNSTHQFLNFITCLAAAGGPASMAEGTPTALGNLPFFLWGPP